MTDPQLLLFADVLPDGSGGFVVRPRKPIGPEITTVQAAKILGLCRASMWNIRNQPLGQKLLRWRFTTPGKKRILWDADSVIAYRTAVSRIED